jgi:hypothetical protein
MKMVQGTERLEQGTMRSNWILDMSDNITPRYTETIDGGGIKLNNTICRGKVAHKLIQRQSQVKMYCHHSTVA